MKIGGKLYQSGLAMTASLSRSASASILVLLSILFVSLGENAQALESDRYKSQAITAQLITAEDGIAPGAEFVSAGLKLDLEEGWKAYWRSPGEVGLPPEIEWIGSTNLSQANWFWPAPTRFRAFGIENFGYEKAVTFPLQLQLEKAGTPLSLRATVHLLVCSNVCVPETFELVLDMPLGTGVDTKSADEIAVWSERIPLSGPETDIVVSAAGIEPDTRLVVELSRPEGWVNPDLFPEYGAWSAFGAPDIRLSDDKETLWTSLPILALDDAPSELQLTVVDEDFAVTFERIQPTDFIASPPREIETIRQAGQLYWILLLAFLGGAVLNAMPCVLPVLSIKFSSAIKRRDRGPTQVRLGFLATAAGTITFMAFLAFIVAVLQKLGYSVGWGLQFQNPYFLIALSLIVGLFAANLFGIFEISLPSSWTTWLSGHHGTGYLEDFSTGALAAVLATPCSAPLLGTAIAFALTGTATDVFIIFVVMGIGLALPYFLAASWPSILSHFPKPGRWMLGLKFILALLLGGTVAWLLWVLSGVSSPLHTWLVLLGLGLTIILAHFYQAKPRLTVLSGLITTLALALAVPAMLPGKSQALASHQASYWVGFDRAQIAREVSRGNTVFVDVTADWCLTCKANKTLVLDRDPVFEALAEEAVIAMRADWTRPDETIRAFLESHGRYAIPFNVVYGPDAPEGIVLPELLSSDVVLDALTSAKANPAAQIGAN